MNTQLRKYLSRIGRKGGSLGGLSKSAAKLAAARANLPKADPEQARRAALARWDRERRAKEAQP